MIEDFLTVSQINKYIKERLNNDSFLNKVYIKGEISNAKLYRSGHFYFTLKDESSQISGVMFAAAHRLKFKPKDGMNVLIEGKIDVYSPYGKYQLYADKISQDGIGDLYVAFEQLKEKLNNEGLFDKSHKKNIPQFPKKIGVITAPNGAAIRDIITTINRRWPIAEIILFPSLVQGELAAKNIVRQIKKSQDYDLDTLIVGRGGGSIEDLWSFNEEIVARAIFECNTPVISAVGHEIDFTISDYVADLRAPTPTVAGEMVVPNIFEIKNYLNQFLSRIHLAIDNRIDENQRKLSDITKKNIFTNPGSIYHSKEMLLDNLINRIDFTSKNIVLINKNKLDILKNNYILNNPSVIIDKYRDECNHQIDKLEMLNPLNTLKRGYTLARYGGKVISTSKVLNKGDEIEIEFNDGKINSKVI